MSEFDTTEVASVGEIEPEGKGRSFTVRTIRVHKSLFSRLKALGPWLESQLDYAPYGALNAHDRLCVAVRRGIEALEEDQAQAKGKKQ